MPAKEKKAKRNLMGMYRVNVETITSTVIMETVDIIQIINFKWVTQTNAQVNELFLGSMHE